MQFAGAYTIRIRTALGRTREITTVLHRTKFRLIDITHSAPRSDTELSAYLLVRPEMPPFKASVRLNPWQVFGRMSSERSMRADTRSGFIYRSRVDELHFDLLQ